MKPSIFLGLVLSGLIFGCASTTPSELERERRITANPLWDGSKFQNIDPTPDPSLGEIGSMAWDFLFEKPTGGTTDPPLPARALELASWPQDLDFQFAWLGHTTYYYEIEGQRILTDPMFSQKAGSFGPLSPKRYSDLAVSIEELPNVDLVLITHNHYDHLDESSIKALIPKTKQFIVPLGVGALMEDWGVPTEKITEVEWWDQVQVGGLEITCAPAQHFSGRGLFDRNKTLWASYGIRGATTNLYLSGDSGWHKGLFEIGERLGPFDVTFIEMGAYGKYPGWKEIHFTPEDAVKAHQALQGKVMIPSHWGTFDLAMFVWYEPIERFVAAADQAEIAFLTPQVGERINPGHVGGSSRWWREYIQKKP